jgi:hypothetical protein
LDPQQIFANTRNEPRMTKASGVLARSAIAQENTPYQTTEVEALGCS